MLFNKPKYYDSCNDLPLYNFIKLLSTKDLSYLVISGKPKNLPEVWDKVFNEYVQLTGSEKQTQILALTKEVAYLGNKIFMVNSVIYSLRIQYSEELVGVLKKLGFTISLNVKNLKDYERQLDLLSTRLKSTISIYEKKAEELKKINSSDDNETNIESQYLGWLTELSKFQGYRLNPKDITVTEFVNILNNYKEAAKKVKK